jgi:hypothetical protein
MASPPFARHCGESATEEERKVVAMAAASADPDSKPVPYDKHVQFVTLVRKLAGKQEVVESIAALGSEPQLIPSLTQLFASPVVAGTAEESSKWEALLEAMMHHRAGTVLFPGADGVPTELSLLDVLLASAYVCDGRTFPQALCTAMIAGGVAAVQLSPTVTVNLLGALEACSSFWKSTNNGESAAAFSMLLADSLYAAGRTHDAAIAIVGAIEAAPLEVYPWAVLCDLLEEQEDADAHVNVPGAGRVDLARARIALAEAQSKQQVGGTIRWSTLAAVAGVVVVGMTLLLRRRRS